MTTVHEPPATRRHRSRTGEARRPQGAPRHRPIGHAARVAAGATVLLAAVAVAAVAVADVFVTQRLQAEVDARLHQRLHSLADLPLPPAGAPVQEGPSVPATLPPEGDLDDAPLLVWQLDRSGQVVARSAGAPAVPAQALYATGPFDTTIRGSTARVDHVDLPGGGRLVAAQSLVQPLHVRHDLLLFEALGAPLVLGVVYLSALVIGLRASAPVEQARRRQLEFTADASHELRTPLAVIEAEVDLGLSGERPAADYRDALHRIGGESDRLRRIVEDLLWLARFDSTPATPANEPVDLRTVVEVCAGRFQPLAAAKAIDLSVRHEGDGSVSVKAPPEWIDRLVGVLVDNAIRYTPDEGSVTVSAGAAGGRAHLVVEDSGPGIPPEARPYLFDRFRRATDAPGGSGLGLAIADTVVRSTHARWAIGTSGAGGARMEVWWPTGSTKITRATEEAR